MKKNPKDALIINNIFIEKIPEAKNSDRFTNYIIYYPKNDIILDPDEDLDWICDVINKKDYQIVIGGAKYDNVNEGIELVRIVPQYRLKGLADYLYDYIERDQNVKLKPSWVLLDDGKKFWEKRSKRITNPKKSSKKKSNVIKNRSNKSNKRR